MNANVYHLLSERFTPFLADPCLEIESGRTYTYADLERATARLARFFTGLGVPPGARIAVQVEKSPEALFTYLAAVRAGLVYLPLNTAYQRGEMEYFLRDAEPDLIVCRPAALAATETLAQTTGTGYVYTLDSDGTGSLLDAAQTAPTSFETVAVAEDEVAAIVYTSGTTGRPKGAMLTHGNLGSNVRTLHASWGFERTDVLLHTLPLFHVHGLFVASNVSLFNAGKMLYLRRFEAGQAMDYLPRATVFMGVPTYYTRLLAEPAFTAEACRGMRLFVSGSAPLLAETFTGFRSRTGHAILERYGMSETGMNTSNPLDGERRAGTVGPPLPGVSVRVVDDADQLLPPGSVAHVQVKGANVFKGYWRMPDKTAEEFTADGYFRTGDLGSFDAQGYLTLVGRSKDLVITGGYNVYPKELETLIDEMPGVIESAVVGVPHPDFGEAVTAVVVARPGAALTEADVIERLKGAVANYKVPKRVHFTNELPRNTMGKVQKNILRARYPTA